MSCCNSIRNLGCIYSCDTIQIEVNAPVTGIYTLETYPEGVKLVKTTNTIGTPLVFASGYLNEDATTVFKIIKPDGTYFETADGEDCFQVTVQPASNPVLADMDIAPVGCDDATVKNSNNTFNQTVASGGTLNLTDITYEVEFNGLLHGSQTLPAAVNHTINITF